MLTACVIIYSGADFKYTLHRFRKNNKLFLFLFIFENFHHVLLSLLLILLNRCWYDEWRKFKTKIHLFFSYFSKSNLSEIHTWLKKKEPEYLWIGNFVTNEFLFLSMQMLSDITLFRLICTHKSRILSFDKNKNSA